MQPTIINQRVKTFTRYSFSILLFASISITTQSVSAATVLNAPSSFLATPKSTTQIDLSWTDNSSDETAFNIRLAGTPLTTTAANAITHSHTGLSCGTTYSYTLTAANANGDSSGVSATATTTACAVSAPIDFDFNKPAKVFTIEVKVK